MTERSANSGLRNHLDTLSRIGVVGNSTDGQLLGMFVAGPEAVAQAAFSALMERHGPMVFRVCRQLLGDFHEAQDAYQATFLVLALKASSVRKADSVASWLHGVALKVAARAQANAHRGKILERRAAESRASESRAEEDTPETWRVLHEEIARLSERHRQPVVLCYLEGLSTEIAAQRLGCPRGTVLSRLSWARERLRQRLTRRGLALPAATTRANAKADGPALAPGAITTAALRMAEGGSTTGLVSMTATTWARGVARTMILRELVIVVTVGLVVTTGVGALAYQGGGGQAPRGAGAGQGKNAETKPAQSPPPPRREEDIAARDKAIAAKLATPVALDLPRPTTLASALKAIRQATQGPNEPGIPIHVDPDGLREAGIDLAKPIDPPPSGRQEPLAATLRSLLRPLGLDSHVHNGLLMISSRDRVVDRKLELLEQELQRVKELLKSSSRLVNPT